MEPILAPESIDLVSIAPVLVLTVFAMGVMLLDLFAGKSKMLLAFVSIIGLLMTAISIVSDQIGTDTGLSVSLFPMVIISMVIERMSVVWEERGGAKAIREGLGSLAIASLAYLVMSLDVLAYWATVFPEVNLIVLGLIIALGRYTGFRLSEIARFRQLAAEAPKP